MKGNYWQLTDCYILRSGSALWCQILDALSLNNLPTDNPFFIHSSHPFILLWFKAQFWHPRLVAREVLAGLVSAEASRLATSTGLCGHLQSTAKASPPPPDQIHTIPAYTPFHHTLSLELPYRPVREPPAADDFSNFKCAPTYTVLYKKW
jgi:hypothetical protein